MMDGKRPKSPRCNCTSKWHIRWEEAVKAREFALNEANEWKRKFLAEQDRRRELSKALIYFLKQDQRQPVASDSMVKRATAMLSETQDATALLTPTLPSFDLDYDDEDESTDEDNTSITKSRDSAKPIRNKRLVNLTLDDDYKQHQPFECRPVRSSTIDAGRLTHSPRQDSGDDNEQDQHHMIRMLYSRSFLGDSSVWPVSSHSSRLHNLVRSMTCFQTKKNRVFEHFIVTGLLATSGLEPVNGDVDMGNAWKPKVLFQYPPSSIYPINEHAVSGFCFPVGVPAFSCSAKDAEHLQGTLVSNWTTDATSSFRQALDPYNTQCYTFRLTGSKGEALYGFCAAILMNAEEPAILLDKGYVEKTYSDSDDEKEQSTVQSPSPDKASPPKQKASESFYNETYHSLAGILASPVTGADPEVFGTAPTSVITPRCYCFTSKYPFYQLHFQFLRMIIEADMKTRYQARLSRENDSIDFEVVVTEQTVGMGLKPSENLHHATWTSKSSNDSKLLDSIASKIHSKNSSMTITEECQRREKPSEGTQSTRTNKLFRSQSWSYFTKSPRKETPKTSRRRGPTSCVVEQVTLKAVHLGIVVGDVLTAINGFPLGIFSLLGVSLNEPTDEMAFHDILQLLHTSKRPIKLRFRRHHHGNKSSSNAATQDPTKPLYGSAVFDLLRRFRSMKISEPGEWSTIKLRHHELKYQFPVDRTDEWTIIVLLRLLDSTTIVQVLACLLLEKQVTVVSESTAKLSVINTAFLTLLQPYSWQSTFIPILPSNLLDFLHSPVPYLVGVHPIFSTDEWPDVCFVYVDSDTLECPFTHLLSFPGDKELTRIFHEAARKFKQFPLRPGHPWFEASDREAQVLQEMLPKVKAQLTELCSGIKNLVLPVEEGKTTYDVLQEEFIKTVQHGSHQEFMSEFAQTQLFCQYCEQDMHMEM